jgi:capsular exopolysaccharide synthesis family protein
LELEARYQKGSTLMTKVDNEIDSFEAIIRPLEMRGMKIVEVDSVSNQFAFEYSKLRSELIPLQDNQKTLTQQMRELKAQFSNAPPELIELKKLESQKAFSETILKELGQQKERQKIVQATAKEPAKVFAYAVSSERASKSMLFFLAAGIVASFAFSLVAIVALQQWDNTIHSSIDFRRHFKLPILGVHPVWEKDKKVTDMYDSTKQEAYETLKTHIAHSPFKHVEKCLLVVSALQREGKTFTSKHLAQSYAREGKNVILVMGDLRKTADLDDLKIKGDIGCGLSDYLEGKADLRQVVYASELSPSMFVIPNGDRISHPSTLLKKDEMDKLISFLKKKFDVVIIDSPAVLPVSDYSHYMKFAHGVIVILRAAFTPLGSEKHAIQKLEQVKAPIIGVLLNQALKRDMTVDYYYGSNYSGYYDEK